MSSFYPAYDLLMINEGGYQNHPNDPGNYNSLNQLVGTNWGISAPFFEAVYGFIPTEQDMKSITKSESQQIYKNNLWTPFDLGNIDQQYLANQLFDMRVNHQNWMWAINRALIAAGAPASIYDSWGNYSTVKMINELPDPALFNDFLVEYRIKYYEKLIADNPSLSAFYNGWISRANRYLIGADPSQTNWLPLLVAAGSVLVFPIAIREAA